ncbi:MAG: acyl-CoA dehydrogenase family protein, partial [Polyangiales bacterium]
MEFSFSEDQNELRRTARRFLEVASSEGRVRTAMETERGYDPATWAQLSEELAWTALTIPEEYGGLGMSYLDLHPLMEELGRALLCAPFLSTVGLGANALLLGGSEAQKQLYLPRIAAGETRATLAFAEKNGKTDATGIEATYARNESGYLLSGNKSYVLDGHTADLLVVAARSERSAGTEGVSLFLVPNDAEGLKRAWLPTMDQTRRLASVELRDVTVSNDALLGDEGRGWAICEKTLDLARIALAAEQVGAAEMCLELSVEYAKVRQQFGRPIGSFQSIKHK